MSNLHKLPPTLSQNTDTVEALVDKRLPGAEVIASSAGNLSISLGQRLSKSVPVQHQQLSH